jgi:hypothetical protein
VNSGSISKQKILNKICFASFGTGLNVAGSDLQEALQGYRRQRSDEIVTRQAVDNWFKLGSLPSRQPAFQFLCDYLETQVTHSDKSPDQRMVHAQCLGFLQSSLKADKLTRKIGSPGAGVQSSAGNNILLVNSLGSSEIEDFSASWHGIYVSFRMRLVSNKIKPISREVVRLSRKNRDIVYEHWHLREGVMIDKFSGLAAPKSDTVWMFGSNSENSRFRICHFKKVNTINPAHKKVRWGLLHSDVPLPSSREPVSTRLMWLQWNAKIHNFEEFLDQNVSYISADEIPADIRETVLRGIDNNVSATSKINDILPLASEDHVLQVNQKTLESMCEKVDGK